MSVTARDTREKAARSAGKPRSSARPGRPKAGRPVSKRKGQSKKRIPVSLRPVVPVTLGLVWGLVLIAAVNAGTFFAALVLLPIGVIAGASAAKAAGGAVAAKAGARQVSMVAMATPVVLIIGALAGPVAAVVFTIIVGALVALAVLRVLGPRMRVVPTTIAALAPAVACMSVVLARGQGPNEADALVGAICAYDLACFIMGNSRTALGGPIGVVFGWISIAVVAIFAAAIMDPPFSGDRAWVLFGLVAALAPVGVILANWVVSGTRFPALRRLDSLLLAGPAWVIGTSYLLHR
jgi:hypothetical protein